MAKTCRFPGCGAVASDRCDNCGGHVCGDHVRDDGRHLLCLTCEPEPVRIPLGAGCRVRVRKGGASVYGDPDARAEKLMFLNPGSEVEAIEEVGGFYRVLAGEGEGYVSRFSAEFAGVRRKTQLWWRRVGATLVDATVSWVVFSGAALLLGGVHASDWTSRTDAAVWIASAATLPYWWLIHGTGRSVGKRLLGLRIVDESGLTPNFRTALARSCASIVSGLPWGLGYLWALWDNGGQTWHDKIAGTHVARRERVSTEDSDGGVRNRSEHHALSGTPGEVAPATTCAEAAHPVAKGSAPSVPKDSRAVAFSRARGEVLPPGTSAFERPDCASAKLFKFPAGLVLRIISEEQGFYGVAVFGTDRHVYVPMDALSPGADDIRAS